MKSDLNAVAIFLKVVELKNFRAAARELGIPRSTVSLKVAQLEDQLGARLLERTTRTLRLTDAGLAYHRRAAPAVEALTHAEAAVGELQAAPSGRLRITTAVEFGQNSPQLAAALAEYMRRYPAVELLVELLDRRVNLVEEGFDLAIRSGELADSSLIALRLGPGDSFRCYASPAYLARRGAPRRPADVRHHDCLIMTARSQATTWQFRSKRGPIAVEVRPRATANSFLVMRALAEAGLGIVRLPGHLAADPLANGRLRAVLDDYAIPPTPWHAVYPSARYLSPKVRAFVELLQESFAGSPD